MLDSAALRSGAVAPAAAGSAPGLGPGLGPLRYCKPRGRLCSQWICSHPDGCGKLYVVGPSLPINAAAAAGVDSVEGPSLSIRAAAAGVDSVNAAN